jgi:hypothetical protein
VFQLIYLDSGPVIETVTAEKQFFAFCPAYVWLLRIPFGIRISRFEFSVENRWYLGAKRKKSKKSLIPYHARAYDNKSAYNYVDFRVIRAGCSNSRGALCVPLAPAVIPARAGIQRHRGTVSCRRLVGRRFVS